MNNKCNLKSQTGMSLIEVMVALVIGIVLMLGLVSVFINSSNSRTELEKSSALIENGRYAVSIIAEDLSLAGFYGFYSDVGVAPATLPDPCGLTEVSIQSAMTRPIQGYRAANLTSSPDIDVNTTTETCEATLLTAANLQQGSDVLVVRRADTATTLAAAMSAKEVYIEQNLRDAVILIDDAATGLLRSPAKTGSPAADIRKFHTHVYFIAPCSRGSGANGICTGGDDALPTLKRLSLGAVGAATVMEIEPLVEGIEYMKFEYGIDTSPTTVSLSTGSIGDGIPDSYVTTPAANEWESVVSVQVFLLARSPTATSGHIDSKAYVLGSTAVAATSDSFKRHVYSTEVRPTNVAGRREIP
ncbi:MAG: type IV pilus assembly protein PilW [Gammaproteobacteria bacterium]|jgi:type IV pilus assembly protein PilW